MRQVAGGRGRWRVWGRACGQWRRESTLPPQASPSGPSLSATAGTLGRSPLWGGDRQTHRKLIAVSSFSY